MGGLLWRDCRIVSSKSKFFISTLAVKKGKGRATGIKGAGITTLVAVNHSRRPLVYVSTIRVGGCKDSRIGSVVADSICSYIRALCNRASSS